jgi:hypothetical protein
MRLSGSGFGFLWGVPVLSGLFTLVTVVILARVGGRLLGIRMRWRRAVLAGFAGLVLGWTAAWSINGQRRGPQALSWPAVLLGSLIATMLVAVMLELLARPGRLAAVEGRLRAGPVPHPIRSLRQRAGRSRRYLRVTRIAARHGLSSYLTGRPGANEPGRSPGISGSRWKRRVACSSSSARCCRHGPTCCRPISSPSCPCSKITSRPLIRAGSRHC